MTTPMSDAQQHAAPAFRVAVPVDGSDLAAKALPIASDLCRRLNGELVLMRVVPPVKLPYPTAFGYAPMIGYEQLQDDAEHEARDYLEQIAASIRAEGITVTTRLEGGTPAATLVDSLPSLHADLVVMTTHGRTGLARTVLGSVADQVVRSSIAPVLLLRSFTVSASAYVASTTTEQSIDLAHTLVPLDGTALAEIPLFTIGLQLAGPVLREITLLRVVDPKEGDAAWTVAEEYLDAVRRRLIDRLQEQGRACPVNPLARRSSDPAAIVVECAQSNDCDLILMATHGAAGIGRVVFGSVTDRVLRDGKSPLLLMHPPHSRPES